MRHLKTDAVEDFFIVMGAEGYIIYFNTEIIKINALRTEHLLLSLQNFKTVVPTCAGVSTKLNAAAMVRSEAST